MAVRIRITELLEAKGWTPYKLAIESDKRISLSQAYRLAQSDGRLTTFPAPLLDALAVTFGVPLSKVLERVEDEPKAPPKARRRGKA